MPSRELSFPVFDADNHMYEPQEALTKFLPDKRKNVIDYVQVRGRTKIVVRGHISEYIPNPTFEKVAKPGAQEDYFRHGAQGKTYREILGEPMKAIPARAHAQTGMTLISPFAPAFSSLASINSSGFSPQLPRPFPLVRHVRATGQQQHTYYQRRR